MSATAIPQWMTEVFRCIDAKDTGGFLSFLTPDAEFRYGAQPPMRGHEEIGRAVDGIFQTFPAIRHELVARWQGGGHELVEGVVTYTFPDGDQVGLPFVNVLAMNGVDRVRSWRIFIDPAPVGEKFAAMASAAN